MPKLLSDTSRITHAETVEKLLKPHLSDAIRRGRTIDSFLFSNFQRTRCIGYHGCNGIVVVDLLKGGTFNPARSDSDSREHLKFSLVPNPVYDGINKWPKTFSEDYNPLQLAVDYADMLPSAVNFARLGGSEPELRDDDPEAYIPSEAVVIAFGSTALRGKTFSSCLKRGTATSSVEDARIPELVLPESPDIEDIIAIYPIAEIPIIRDIIARGRPIQVCDNK